MIGSWDASLPSDPAIYSEPMARKLRKLSKAGGVRTWPMYTFHAPRAAADGKQARIHSAMPEWIREAISEEAEELNLSLADTIRQTLCARFRLDCQPQGFGYYSERDQGAVGLVIRVHPDLFAAIKVEAERSQRTMRAVILETLETHYEERKAA